MSAVLVGMMLGRFGRVVGSVLSVPMRYVSVVTCLLVISTLVVLGSFTMVFRCVLMVFSRLVMMLRTFVCHFVYLSMSSFAGQFRLSSEISILLQVAKPVQFCSLWLAGHCPAHLSWSIIAQRHGSLWIFISNFNDGKQSCTRKLVEPLVRIAVKCWVRPTCHTYGL
jgi:hypothetical protein